MSEIRVASRYAKSLLQLSVELKNLDKTFEDMTMIKEACESSDELALLLKSPLVNSDKKLSIIREVFKGSFSKITDSFVELITKKKRELLLLEIADQFIHQYKEYKNIEVATITTAIPLNDNIRKEIPKIIADAMNSDASIEMVEQVDETLIGGIVLRVGDQQFDDSVKRKLRKLEMEFGSNPYISKV